MISWPADGERRLSSSCRLLEMSYPLPDAPPAPPHMELPPWVAQRAPCRTRLSLARHRLSSRVPAHRHARGDTAVRDPAREHDQGDRAGVARRRLSRDETETQSQTWPGRHWCNGFRPRILHNAWYLVTGTALRGRRDADTEGV